MARATLNREWTEAEQRSASKIVQLVYDSPQGILHARQLARHMCGSANRIKIDRMVLHVYDVMPLAVKLSTIMYPGKALLVGRDRVYRIVDDALHSKRTALDRSKKVHTALARVQSEIEPLRAQSDLGSLVVVKLVDQALAILDPALINAVIQEAEASAD